MANLPNGLETIEIGQDDAREALNRIFETLDDNRFLQGPRSARPASPANPGLVYLTTSYTPAGEGGSDLAYWDGADWVTLLSNKVRLTTAVPPAMASDDGLILLDPAGAGATQNLTLLEADDSTRAAGVPVAFKRISGGGNGANILAFAPKRLIDGAAANYALPNQWDSVTLVSDGGTGYLVVAEVP